GMLLLSGLIGLPFALAAEWSSRGLALIQAIAGVISGGLGLPLLWALSLRPSRVIPSAGSSFSQVERRGPSAAEETGSYAPATIATRSPSFHHRLQPPDVHSGLR